MTVIAYRNGVMACDSCWATNEVIDNLACKITRLKSGALIGQAGDNDARDVVAHFNTIRDPRHFPTREDLWKLRIEFLGLLVLPSKRVFKVSTTVKLPESEELDTDDIGIWEILLPFSAVGAGHEVALGAMAAGKSAREAAAIACGLVTSCRPPIHTRALSTRG